MRLSIVQEPAKSGALLMAEDLSLLEAAERGELPPTLRLYEWSEPTISLGFHQSADVLDLERLRSTGMPWVRRPTGGAAVLHSEELTYAILLPACAQPLQAARVQELVSRAIAGALQAVGVRAAFEMRGEPLSALPNRASCFVRTSRWEVTAGGRKIVGSAQRRLGHAMLQHGSILTGDDHLRIADYLRLSDDGRRALRARLADKSTSIRAELRRAVPVDELRRELVQSFAAMFACLEETRPSPVAQ